ncbi:MAG: DNA/RNA nuclease SfsA [Clostridia bacterium]|nr:DNA/RNA nuclease SfsA [Clostridia bacterium]
MKYEKVVKGEFLSRPNRFIAKVLIDGEEETVHVKNTGRCRELLTDKAEVFLAQSENPARKTKYDLVAVRKGEKLINMDSQIPNDVAGEWLKKGNLFSENAHIRREVTKGKSRFDFYIEDGDRKIFLEVKGVTLENEGVAMFPDAPTERGVKHINELISLKNEGYEAYILFVIQMKEVFFFKPNDITHKAFGDALRKAENAGVKILAMNCEVTEDSIEILNEIEVDLNE